MAAASKKPKLDAIEDSDFEGVLGKNEQMRCMDTLIYIVPKKISKARLQVLKDLSRKKGFPLTERFRDSVTHIVTAYESTVKVLAFLERQLTEDVEIVSLDWLTDCTTVGKLVAVTDQVRIRSSDTSVEESSRNDNENQDMKKETIALDYQDTKYVCQRATPLNHLNAKFTDALEILERHAVYVDSGQRDSRALAFRRAACALKSYPKQISRIEEAAKLSSVGNHSKKVIQDILENGSSSEIQDIISSDFFKAMEFFSSIYGCGSATGRRWYDKGYRNLSDITKAIAAGMKITEQLAMGLKYYDDLIQSVPREEAMGIKNVVVKELNSIQPKCKVELVGGYRRGKESGHDVDILITHEDDCIVEGLLVKLVERLDKLGCILHKDLMVGHNSHFIGSQKQTSGHMDHLDHCFCMFQLIKTTNAPTMSNASAMTSAERTSFSEERGGLVRRVDLIVTPYKQFPFALLGWTGSKQFNRSIRDYAWKTFQIKLSSHGMWDHNFMPPHQIEARSEQEIFAALRLQYREPEERNA
ncbi:DNA nucleotidylexotransferase-like [Montipora foliosa]|uniref:DNA nucleotidylexotransferase-like n=1 Tax=Montipora foliosa TaxID=591990 RepID=UPI0035F1CD0A